MNHLNTHDSFNQPRGALSDLVALLSLADVDGAISNAIHSHGMDTAYTQALEAAVQALDHDGIDKIDSRYDIPAPTLDALRAQVPASNFPSSSALEVGHVNLLRITESTKALEELTNWLQAEASYRHVEEPNDFVVNLACSFQGVPDLLMPVFTQARQRGYGYLFLYLE